MARPDLTAFTDRLYGRLPALYRAADEAQADGPTGWPLLRYLSLLGDVANDIETLVDRIDPAIGGTSDLVDPVTADARWLPYIATAAGVLLLDVTDPARRRAMLVNADDVRTPGALRSLRVAVRPLLTGSQTVYIADHYGDDWTVAIVTLAPESDGTTPAEILEAAEDQRPAGVRFVHAYGLTWTALEANMPTWADIEAAGSWRALA